MKMLYRATTIAMLAIFSGQAALAAQTGTMPMAAGPTVKHAQGKGVIKAVDPKARTITIAHGAIPTLGWPPMTMTFTVAPRLSLLNLKLGDKIVFDLDSRGMSGVVTSVRME